MSENSAKKTYRIDSIDILRALGIIIMIAGHIDSMGGKFDRYIHTFHMPLFFLISGYLYRLKDGVSLFSQIKQKAKRMLLPYFVYAMLNYFFWLILEKDDLWYIPLVQLVTYNTHDLPICGALWFLTALFWTESFYLILDYIISRKPIRTFIIVICAVIVASIQNNTSFRLPLTIDTAIVCMLFFEIGQLLKTKGKAILLRVQLLNNWKIVVYSSLFIAFNLVLAFVNPYVNVKSGWYGIIPLFFLNACIGTTGYYLIAFLLDKNLSKEGKVRSYLLMIGRLSLIFMGLNQLVILTVQKVWSNNIFLLPEKVYAMMVFFLVLIILSILAHGISKIKNKRIRTLFGI